MIIIYGIKNCDSCKKAIKYFSSNAKFWDIRDFPLPRGIIKKFIFTFGSDLINARSKTWRDLSELDKSLNSIDLIINHSTVMKRPVIDHNGTLSIGWNDEIKKSLPN